MISWNVWEFNAIALITSLKNQETKITL